ncbi:anhydro-N-acetylmuramic acid kinase [Flavobacterium sp.]|uniref:anhydro-N-acetylmuramic acid kinase n=1 Tax=Flavobacterium sp. TaxID=239 RepID=UPI0035294DBA
MIKNDYKIIGVMSGTSLDGIDIVYCHFFYKKDKWNFFIKNAETIAYSKEWYEKLQAAFDYDESEMERFNNEYTIHLAAQISSFIAKYSIIEIDAVCSHGHTILHQPENGFTLQIGNLPILSSLLNQNVVCDFRVQDVQLGGQGAPLVPIGDELLFFDYNYCLNLGGFSNISFQENNKRIAFDISPVNIVLNHFANQLGFSYDDGGNLAKEGNCNKELLSELNALPYYQLGFPKSLGKEFITSTILPLISKYELPIYDILRTFTEHVAIQINQVIKDNKTVLVTGGGAYNSYLIELLQKLNSSKKYVLPNNYVIQFKEAVIFGFLGVLRLRNEINVLASVTGAKQNHSSGTIYLKNNTD